MYFLLKNIKLFFKKSSLTEYENIIRNNHIKNELIPYLHFTKLILIITSDIHIK